MSGEGSVTGWIGRLKAGDQSAAQQLWERYFARLVRLARKRLAGRRLRAADEEDVALSAFTRFCVGAEHGQFPLLADRDDLWHLLVVITSNKAVDYVRQEHREKRGGGGVIGASVMRRTGNSTTDGTTLDQIISSDPTPEFAALVAEECGRLLEELPDDTLRKIALWKMEGYTTEEIAQKLGCAVRTVERKLGRIRVIWSEEIACGSQ